MLGKRWHHSTEMGTIYTKLADTRQLLTSRIPHIVYNKRIDITLVGFFYFSNFQTDNNFYVESMKQKHVHICSTNHI